MKKVAVVIATLLALVAVQETNAQTARKNGLVKSWNDAKGYGFITDGKSDLYVARSSILDTQKILKEGEKVTYEVAKTAKGSAAVNVKAAQ